MKKQYIAALACLVAGTIGFVGVYQTQSSGNRKESEVAEEEETKKVQKTSKMLKPDNTTKAVKEESTENNSTEKEEEIKEEAKKSDNKLKSVETKADANVFHFSTKEKHNWPLEGEVILPYCMDKTIYRKTLEQYQYNPAMVIKGNVNSEVHFIAKGKVLDIVENEETGCTLTQDLGDGYKAIYGQLKETVFAKGDMVEAGQVAGYVSEPTKYYSMEGSNLYFQITKDDKPVNPQEYLK